MSDHSGGGPDRPMHTGIELQRLPGGATIVRATGDLHGDAAAVLRRTFTDELTGSPELFVLDLSDVARIDRDGIDALRSGAAMAAHADIAYCLVVEPVGAVKAALDTAGLTEMFELFSSVTEALRETR